jgi:hypothetical protein
MQITVIGEYEITHQSAAEPALVIHHVIRGYDVVHLAAEQCAELAQLLTVRQKRIRTLGTYQLILGEGGDLAFYTNTGQRACYLNPDQAAALGRFLQ